MNEIVIEWIEKAEGDFVTATRELKARARPNYDAACFHAQQCIEKYMKAALQMHQMPFQKTHDLSVLLNSCVTKYPLWEGFRNDMKLLTQYAVEFRYPGEAATRDQAKRAVTTARKIREEIRHVFGKVKGGKK